jgi:cellulose synthase/poly-beta-1,6-N-acetylglucosamine synthase-like glycosyltransferase
MNFEGLLNSRYTLVLCILLLVSFVALCLYYGLLWLRTARCRNDKLPKPDQLPSTDRLSVSVVIVTHNEADALKKTLPYLLEQDYPDYEVVVVDYMSTDDTPFVLRVCSENYSNLKVVKFKEDVNMFRGKKYPLSIGIKSADGDIILLTEPDCRPKGFDWISEMVCGYMHGATLVLGYNILSSRKGLLNALERYDNLTYTASYAGSALLGNPYTATGRNLSYKRQYFFDRGGFISHYSFPDGADDIFVNQNANSSNTVVNLRDGAGVICESSNTFGEWRLRRLHRRTSRRFYPVKDKVLLAIYPLSQVLFLACLVLLFIDAFCPWQVPAIVLAVKIIWQIICSFFLAKKFKIKLLHFFSPFFEFYFLLADTFLALSTLRKKNTQWR